MESSCEKILDPPQSKGIIEDEAEFFASLSTIKKIQVAAIFLLMGIGIHSTVGYIKTDIYPTVVDVLQSWKHGFIP